MYGKNWRPKNDVCFSGCKGLTALTTSLSIDTIWPNNHQTNITATPVDGMIRIHILAYLCPFLLILLSHFCNLKLHVWYTDVTEKYRVILNWYLQAVCQYWPEIRYFDTPWDVVQVFIQHRIWWSYLPAFLFFL